MEIRMKYAETLFLLLVCLVSGVFLVISAGYSDMARAVPNICSVFVILCIIFRLGQIWLGNSSGTSALKIHKRALPFVLMLTVYTAGVFVTGFIIASAIFVPICMHWMGQRKLSVVVSVTAAYILLVCLVFVTGVRMPLPESIVGF